MRGDRDGGEGSRRKTKLILLRWQNIINNVSEKPNRGRRRKGVERRAGWRGARTEKRAKKMGIKLQEMKGKDVKRSRKKQGKAKCKAGKGMLGPDRNSRNRKREKEREKKGRTEDTRK